MKRFVKIKTLNMKPGICSFTVKFFSVAAVLVCSLDMSAQKKTIDTTTIERIIGIKGQSNNGEYKVTIPQNDLSVEVDGFKIIPGMGLGTWIAFTPTKDGAMIMGDIVLTETDLKGVQQEVIKQGLTISAIHNHFVRNHPNILYMHIGGSGSTDQVAQKTRPYWIKFLHYEAEIRRKERHQVKPFRTRWIQKSSMRSSARRRP